MLECFVAVADEGSVSRAASALHMTQPPLTVRLQTLERELGVSLLVRHGRGIALTAAGRELAERARRVLADVQLATETVRTVGLGTRGRLTVVAGHTSSPHLLARLTGDDVLGPDVETVLDSAVDREVIERVHGREAHAGILHLPPSAPGAVRHRHGRARGLEVAVIAREPLVAVLRRERADADRVDLDAPPQLRVDLAEHVGEGLAEHVAEVAGPTPRTVRVGSVLQALAVVRAAADAFTLLPADHASSLWGDLVTRPLRQHTGVVETGVCWRPDDDSPVLRRFLRAALSTPEPDVLGGAKARTGGG